jgi:methyl-accepting chemotaxis protein
MLNIFSRDNTDSIHHTAEADTDGETAAVREENRELKRRLSAYSALIARLNQASPDLTEKVPGNHAEARECNSYLHKQERIFSNLLENLITIASAEGSLEETVHVLREELGVQEESTQSITGEAEGYSHLLDTVYSELQAFADEAVRASRSAQQGRQGLDEFLTHIAGIESHISETSQRLANLQEAARKITGVTAMIEDTASRLHVISVNTAIEAARAQAGGFSVIARELQQIAAGTGDAVRDVDALTDDIERRRDEVETALAAAVSSTKYCTAQSTEISKEFASILEGNARLEETSSALMTSMRDAKQGIETLLNAAQRVGASGGSILERADGASSLAEELGALVESILRDIGMYRVSYHNTAVRDFQEIIDGLRSHASADTDSLDAYLHQTIAAHPAFELLYLMNSEGVQVSSNITGERRGFETITTERGQDRSEKDYFTAPTRSGEVYVSNVYLSSAGNDLCITVAAPVSVDGTPGVLAGDINIRDFVEIESGRRRE